MSKFGGGEGSGNRLRTHDVRFVLKIRCFYSFYFAILNFNLPFIIFLDENLVITYKSIYHW